IKQPVVWSPVIALIIVLADIHIPQTISMSLGLLGKASGGLALFAAGSTGLTAAINELTKSTIDQQAALQQKALFDQVLPADRYNNDLLKSCYLVSAPALGKG
ncbi:AEC family transporter, partial [Mycobacterium tuberculosis]|nr:AEC family transporter [Mycobacterium tuberculosis]